MRVDEFKYTWTTEIENAVVQGGNWGGFSGATVTDTGGAICFNLYTNPQEDVSVGPGHLPVCGFAVDAAGGYVRELIKYPPQFKVGFLSNNPPVYDVLPKPKGLQRPARP